MKRLFIFMLLAILSITGFNCSKTNTNVNETEIKIPVEVEKVKRDNVIKEFNYTGDIVAETEVKIFSKVPDRILSFEKDEGEPVKKGDVIVRIEATKIEQAVIQANAALVSAKAQLANLEAEYNRAKRLHKEDAMSQQQFDAIATQYEATQAMMQQSEAALKQAKSQLADANITSPISGIIGVRNYEQGDMASGPLPLVTVVDMQRVKVEINVPEQDLGQLEVGLCANLKVLSYPEDVFTGTISKIRPVLDPMTRMGKIEIIVDNKDQRLKPGMFAEVSICVNTLSNVIVVPKNSLIENTILKRIDGEDVAVVKSQVFVENDGRAILRDIDIAYTNGSVAVVSSGVKEGENLIVVGQQSLKDSALVKVIMEGGN